METGSQLRVSPLQRSGCTALTARYTTSRLRSNAAPRPTWRCAGVPKRIALWRARGYTNEQSDRPTAAPPTGVDGPSWIDGPIFQCLEQRLRKGVVIAHGRADERGHHAQRLQGGQHGRTLHRAAIIRMQYDLVRGDVLPFTNFTHNLAGKLTAFHIVYPPAHDFAAEDIHDEVEIKIDALHRRRQIRDVLAVQLTRGARHQRPRLVTHLSRTFGIAMGELILRFQHPIECRLRRQVHPLIDQARHDLAVRHARELIGVGDGEQLTAFKRAEPVSRRLHARWPPIAALRVTLPALQRAFAERDCRAPRPGAHRRRALRRPGPSLQGALTAR